jgi:hypothetical protein
MSAAGARGAMSIRREIPGNRPIVLVRPVTRLLLRGPGCFDSPDMSSLPAIISLHMPVPERGTLA